MKTIGGSLESSVRTDLRREGETRTGRVPWARSVVSLGRFEVPKGELRSDERHGNCQTWGTLDIAGLRNLVRRPVSFFLDPVSQVFSFSFSRNKCALFFFAP